MLKKTLIATCFMMVLNCWSYAQQYDLVTIEDIQKVANSSLGNCDDGSPREGDTVRVQGTVVMDGDLSRIQGADSRNVWIQDGKGHWSGLDVFGFADETSPTDIQNLVSGDSIEVTGYIEEYQGETEIVPLTGTNANGVELLGQGTVHNQTIPIGDLNDGNQNNNLTTGERWEGAFVTLEEATVVSVDYFSGGDRVSFVIEGQSGNRVNVSDQFLAQRLPQSEFDGNFQPPSVGTFVDSIKGIITHSKNNCPNNNGRGYELQPFDTSHYHYGPAPPTISGISNDPTVPTSSQSTTISATITDNNGVDSAWLYYAVGEGNSNYTKVGMTNASGNTYEADIPAQNDGALVKFYIEARDQDNPAMTNTIPNVPNDNAPEVLRVRDDGLTLYDLQYSPFVEAPYFNDESPYVDQEVTVTGLVTASMEEGNLGNVFIQEKGRLGWAGIQLTQGTNLSAVEVGQKIEVTGTVSEDFGMTTLTNINDITVVGNEEPDAVNVNPTNFSDGSLSTDNEPYEGMLVNLSVNNGQLYVVDTNADGPDDNFAEYRVGPDTLDPNNGTRVLAGRRSGGAFSSLNVSYVNSDLWEFDAGQMNVEAQPVEIGNSMDSLKGILIYSFGNYKILPRNNGDFYNYSDSIEDNGGGDTSTVVNRPQSENFKIYPNPAKREVTIEANGNDHQGTYELRLIGMKGNTVMTRENTAFEAGKPQTLQVGHLPEGAYILRGVDQQTGDHFSKQVLIR